MAHQAEGRAGESLAERVWLTRWALDQSPVEGWLELEGGRVRLTLGRAGAKTARWLEERTAEAGLAERLERGERARVLDVPVEQVAASFTNPVVTPGMKLTENGRPWRLWFMYPNRQSPLQVFGGMREALATKRRWREALGG